MYYPQKINGNKTSVFIIIIFMFIMIIPTTAIMLTTIINPVYGQQDKTSFNTTDSSNIQSIPLKKVQVGDIEIAYKMLGKGDHILLFNGASDVMDGWDPSFQRVFLQITR